MLWGLDQKKPEMEKIQVLPQQELQFNYSPPPPTSIAQSATEKMLAMNYLKVCFCLTVYGYGSIIWVDAEDQANIK